MPIFATLLQTAAVIGALNWSNNNKMHKAIFILVVLVCYTLAATPSTSLPVIVIGAGVAGAGAARRLTENNIPVIVLEARSRMGGRIWTDKSSGVPGIFFLQI